MRHVRRYDPMPTYPPAGESVTVGWADAVASLPRGSTTLAVEGPAIADWPAVIDGLAHALAQRGQHVATVDMADRFVSWDEILRRTDSPELAGDQHFATITTSRLSELLGELPDEAPPADGMLVVFGPGAAEVRHDVLWYADLPKRYAEAAVTEGTGRNIGQPRTERSGTTKRLFYIDWPLLDRHRDSMAGSIDRWLDVQDPGAPASVDGATLRATIAGLAEQPFRTRPTFNTTSWGGHWAQREFGFNPQAPNTALGYELIAPESGILIGTAGGPAVEVPFQLAVSLHPRQIMGERVHGTFGTSFPVRFDYLDTVGGQSLSVHCHPQSDYMRKIFGWPYTQHETYYIMVGGENSEVYLGLRGDVDVDAFHRDALDAHHRRRPFDIEQYVRTFPAEPHQLFLIPAGTPHGSGKGNVVLEVSATPYLYSLRFYDWLRQDEQGNSRPVHISHAFANLDLRRRGDAVSRDLVQPARTLRRGEGWREELLGTLPEMFYEVRRVVIEPGGAARGDASAGFHVLNVVEGEGVVVETATGHSHAVAYAETLLVPAAVGGYRLTPLGTGDVQVVKALVR
ncbi:class I mannose-6-phosphate isomerase [Jiangella asiatica]|uniref:ROK family transcriptional regulator n=1 Tax=Jiangella asiatica TaxID=2530372 RepID=A0A4R5DJK7_9ACTN|nr:class I mannose-6-phosphate isomerase [Jiangella asiatica]TDE14306.1 hypothetical protein E1269_03885 [Jiangella asiatica]